jgi:Na+-transporting NADH:ubiquinone oxidoreductase subunit NqrF
LDGFVGFIRTAIYNDYSKDPVAQEECEYYLHEPLMMNAAVIRALLDIGEECRKYSAG